MAPTYKLIYFDAKGRPEPLRLMFAYKNIDYIDHRISFEEWSKVKPTVPYGQLPVLEVDGKVIAESYAFTRYVAKQLGLVGKNDLDAARADMILDYIKTCYDNPVRFELFLGKDEDKKKEIKEKYEKEIVPPYFANLERDLTANGGIYFVGDDVTWADFVVAYAVEVLDGCCTNSIIKNYPKLAAHMKKVFNLPGVKEWIEKRPKTSF